MSFSADTRSFRVCVLAYSRILHIVHDVIRQLPDTGVEYIVIEAGLADQDACVTKALRQGCEIFVAGPAGATLFANHYQLPRHSVSGSGYRLSPGHPHGAGSGIPAYWHHALPSRSPSASGCIPAIDESSSYRTRLRRDSTDLFHRQENAM